MNSLEFIDKTIESIKYQIEHTKKQIKYGNLSEQVGNLSINDDMKILQTLQQIKAELEAWYVVKDNTMGNDYYYEIIIYKSEKDGYEKFEKALEINNNV